MAAVPCMNSLKTKEVLLRLLEDFENLSRELIDNIASVAAQRGQTKQFSSVIDQILEKIIKKDSEICNAVQIGKEQLLKQQVINQIKEEVSRKDHDILQLQIKLKEAEQVLSNALFEAKRKLSASRQASDATVSSEDLIRYAFRISSSSSIEAPPDWQPGDPRRPYPLDLEMRAGFLGQIQSQTKSIANDKSELTKNQTRLSEESRPNERQANRPDIPTEVLSALNDDRAARPINSSTWSSAEPEMPDVYSQMTKNKEQPYRMISANTVQPREVFNGGHSTANVDDVEYMSSSSDSSSSD
eukprot:gene10719-11867_t